MAHFLNSPNMRVIGKRNFKLSEPMMYDSDIVGRVRVPAGFVTDLASIPRIFQSLIPVNGKHRLAAIVHDYLVRGGATIGGKQIDRAVADKVFLEAMTILRVNWLKRRLMYRAVALATTWLKLRGKA